MAVRKLKYEGTLPIANFGFKNSKWAALNRKSETASVKAKKKDYMTNILNSKRLIPKYAREEREKLRARMQELGFVTAADKKKAENLANKSKHELYSRLEENMNRAVSKMPV